MHVLQSLMLAHGAVGSLDEIIPIALIGGMAVIFIVVGFMARRSEGQPDDGPEQPPVQDAAGQIEARQNESAQDHYHLD
jgi:hypothetical protein